MAEEFNSAFSGQQIDERLGKVPDLENAVSQLSAEKVALPKDEDGNPVYGTAGAQAISDGAGGITWEEPPSGTKSVEVSGSVELTDCIDGDMTITEWTLPANTTEMVVTARKSMNVLDPALLLRGNTSPEGQGILNNGAYTTKGVTIGLKNGKFTLNGTATGQISLGIITGDSPLWLPPGVYQFASLPVEASSSTFTIQWKRVDTDGTIQLDYGNDATGNPTKRFDTDVPVRANLIIYSGYKCDNLEIRPQILTGEWLGIAGNTHIGYDHFYPFEGSSVVITSDDEAPITGLTAFEEYTAIDCRTDGSVSIEYPVAGKGTVRYVSVDQQKLTEEQKAQARVNIGAKEDATNRHRDDTEFTVSELNGSSHFSENDITFVGDELWVSKRSDVYYTNGTMIFRYKVVDGVFTLVGTCDCDFGHLNTMDYCAANDCLIFGSNGDDNDDPNSKYFAVVKNPLALGDTALLADVGIKCVVNVGEKVNAVWGGSNLGAHNIVYLLSNNSANITKVLLLKDANGEFNGSFVTLDTYELDTWGVQGADVFGDTLYIGGQLNANEYAAIKEVSLSDVTKTKIVSQKFYADDGTAVIGCVQGVYVNQDAVWICVNTGDTTKPVCLTKYRR